MDWKECVDGWYEGKGRVNGMSETTFRILSYLHHVRAMAGRIGTVRAYPAITATWCSGLNTVQVCTAIHTLLVTIPIVCPPP